MLGQIDVVHTHDFAAADIDDLLVEQILLYGEPRFIGLIKMESAFANIQANLTNRNGGDLVVTGASGPVDSARYLLSSVLGSDRFRSRTSAVSPSRKATLFLLAHDRKIAIAVRAPERTAPLLAAQSEVLA